MQKSLLSFFSKITKGDQGENEVLTAITKLLNQSGEENYFLVPKAKISDITTSREIDLVLLHPILGLFVIEVKNWESLDYLNDKNNPFEQVNGYKNILLAQINSELGKIPINIEYRVVFPSITKNEGDKFFKENPNYKAYGHHTFFKENLENREAFSKFFQATKAIIPNKKEFIKIASMVVKKDDIAKYDNKTLPIITKDEILFFDHKQLSILNGYTGDFRVIRGVAGTGKTVILTHFVNNKLAVDDTDKFLILCFNKRLADNITGLFAEHPHKNRVGVLSLFEMLSRIGFDKTKIGVDEKTDFGTYIEKLKTPEATQEFREKFQARLAKKPIDYFLCDETQDMPPNIMRVIYEEIKDCIFFIDEAQKFYPYSMSSIGEVFKHPEFEKIDMRGKVKNLNNVYRTPSNIAKMAFEVLSEDSKINAYYKKSHYLKDGFLSDVRFVLEDGAVSIEDWESFEALKTLIDALPENEESIILTQYKNSRYENTVSVKTLNEYLKSIKRDHNIKAMTFQSIKGLEAQNVILHNFDKFLQISAKIDADILFRKVYVLLTRAQQNIYISIDEKTKNQKDEKIQKIITIINAHAKELKSVKSKEPVTNVVQPIGLAKLKPSLESYKSAGEAVVVTAELFAIVAGFFA